MTLDDEAMIETRLRKFWIIEEFDKANTLERTNKEERTSRMMRAGFMCEK